MNTMELIRRRRSVRTFDGRALSPETLREILAFSEKQDNPYGIPIQWRLLDAGKQGLSSPVISGTETFLAGKMKRLPHAEEAFGYTFEKIILHLEAMGIGTTWIAGTMNRKAFEQAMALEADEVMPCVTPLGYPAERMSLKETLMRKGVRAESRMAFRELFFDGSFDRPLTEETAGPRREALEMVRLAPSAVNKQPWRVVIRGDAAHFYEKKGKGYISADGWDIQKIDMGIALYHYSLGMCEKTPDVRLMDRKPELDAPEGLTYIASIMTGEATA